MVVHTNCSMLALCNSLGPRPVGWRDRPEVNFLLAPRSPETHLIWGLGPL